MIDIEKLVLRLKKGKEDATKVKTIKEFPYDVVKKKGFLSGIEDVYKMEYTEFSGLQDVLNRRFLWLRFGSYASKQTREKLNRLYCDELSSTGESYTQLLSSEGVANAFIEGWVDGFSHIWNQVKDKLD